MNNVATPHVKKRHAHKQKQRRFFFPSGDRILPPIRVSVWLCQRFSKFLPVSVHSPKIAQPVTVSRQNTRTQTYIQATASTRTLMLHVICHVDGVQLVGQKAVSQVHPLFLSARVDGNDADVHHDHHSHNQVVLLQNRVGH